MELRQLRYFDAVVRHGGFTHAAEQLHVTQPAISGQVRQLEDELGVRLLRRTTRRVSLTRAGETFLAGARNVLLQTDRLRSEMAALGKVLRGRVRIGATDVLGPFSLPAALAEFRARHPQVSLSMHGGLVADLLARLSRGEVDLVLAPIHQQLPRRIAVQPIAEESLVLVTAPGHPLRTQRALPLAALQGDPFVCLPRGSGLQAILIAACAQQGFKPNIAFEAQSPAGVRSLVAEGLGVALLARSAAVAPGPPVRIHEPEPAVPHPPIGLYTVLAQPLAPAVESFRQLVAERAARAAGR